MIQGTKLWEELIYSGLLIQTSSITKIVKIRLGNTIHIKVCFNSYVWEFKNLPA